MHPLGCGCWPRRSHRRGCSVPGPLGLRRRQTHVPVALARACWWRDAAANRCPTSSESYGYKRPAPRISDPGIRIKARITIFSCRQDQAHGWSGGAETRSNDTHASITDPQARLYRKGKGKEAKLSYIGNALTENRHGLVVEAELGSATGTIEREPAMKMVARHSPGSRRLTLGADKAYDVHGFVDDLRDLNATPHIAKNTTNRTSAIDARTTRHPGYAISQQKRKRTEEPFGCGKTIGGLARPMLRGVARLRFKFTLTMAAYDLIQLPKLLGAAA
jgi:hypothetical protein